MADSRDKLNPPPGAAIILRNCNIAGRFERPADGQAVRIDLEPGDSVRVDFDGETLEVAETIPKSELVEFYVEAPVEPYKTTCHVGTLTLEFDTVEAVVGHLLDVFEFDTGQSFTLQDADDEIPFDLEDTLEEAGIEDGDTLRLTNNGGAV